MADKPKSSTAAPRTLRQQLDDAEAQKRADELMFAATDVKLRGVPGTQAQTENALAPAHVVDYRILSYPLQMMRMKVLEVIEEGYEPEGNVMVDTRDGTFHQVMVKRA